MTPYEVTDVVAAPEVVVQALRDAISSRGIIEYAVVDHGRDMTAAGRPGHWHGRSCSVTRREAPSCSIAIPPPPSTSTLRLGVIGRDSSRSAIVIRPMQTLLPTA
jgi:hypothetical protein